ncbi:MAG TPA: DUF2007 domain-containing protein [Azospirillaceae bacterium]|nr:DUF2007 domain-containing protein [Azospirillaceae bacterium]
MKLLYASNNAVELSWLVAFLGDSGIPAVVLDEHTSVVEGSIGAIPRRLMVDDDDLEEARALLREAGHEPWS